MRESEAVNTSRFCILSLKSANIGGDDYTVFSNVHSLHGKTQTDGNGSRAPIAT